MNTEDPRGRDQLELAGVLGESAEGTCPICSSGSLSVFFEMLGVPTSDGQLWPSQAQARNAARGDIQLAFCGNCGYIGNKAYDSGSVPYGQDYNASLDHSPMYQQFISELALGLIDRFALRHKTIVEIACGSGEFLRLLCLHGDNDGFGFDPAYPSTRVDLLDHSRITFFQDFYSDRFAQYHGDFVCCRHLLSQVSDPKDLVALARRALGDRPNGLVYFEVPDLRPTLRAASIWNLQYEQCSYFSEASLTRLLTTSGFDIVSSGSCFADQYLGVVATQAGFVLETSHGTQSLVDALAADVALFSEHARTLLARWRTRMQDIERTGRRTIAWGAGGRAITFFNTLQVESQIEYLVDVNLHKQGTFLPGTGQAIVPPSFLIDYRPDLVIITNATFEHEIKQQVRDLGVTCDFLVT